MFLLSPKSPTLMLLPYGLCSNKIMIAGYDPLPQAVVPYDPKQPMEKRLALVKSGLIRIESEITKHKKCRFWIQSKRKYGNTERHRFSYCQLTYDSFYYITNLWTSPDQETLLPLDRIKKEIIKNQLKTHYLHFLRLYSARDHDYSDGSSKSLFLKSVQEEHFSLQDLPSNMNREERTLHRHALTPLGLYPYYALNVNPSPSTVPSYRAYTQFKQSNIAGLFMANGFLTYLDRRHYDTDWDFERHISDEDLVALEEADYMTLPEFMTYTLRNYYRNIPSAYSLTNPTMTREEWDKSPEYYMISEIPAFRNVYTEGEDSVIESQCPIKYTCSGVAIGRNAKYVVHHTQRVKTPWFPHVEKSAMRAIQQSLITMGLAKTSREAQVEHCIIVTESQKQFASFFYTAKEKQHNKEMRLLADPYATISIVSLNHCGIEQINGLLNYGPDTFKQILEDELIQRESDYCYTNNLGEGRIYYEGKNSTFRLVFQEESTGRSIPVFVGHTMDLEEINYVYESYLEGLDFLIACYPQQAPYYRELMPGVRFL